MMLRVYAVAAIVGPTIQGEGPRAGRGAVLLRLAGCNAWDGRPASRAASACPACDTDFAARQSLSRDDILARLADVVAGRAHLGCVLTGGEPLLQADADLVAALCDRFPWVDLETNGTRPCPVHPANLTVVCSPKAIPDQPVVVEPDCWKILVPDQEGFLDRALADGRPVFVQPCCPDDGPHGEAYAAAVAHCLELGREHGCRLSLQLHKYIGVE